MTTLDDQARLEEHVRDALAARAAEITQEGIPALRLPGGWLAQRVAARRGARRRWLVPLTAAASVTAVVAGAVLVTGALGGHEQGRAGQHGSRPPVPTVDGLPPYFLAVTSAAGRPRPGHPLGSAVQIVVTATGKAAATASLPDGHVLVTAGPDGTFFAGATVSGPGPGVSQAVVFYSIALPAHGTRARVTRLPVRVPRPGGGLSFLAASPDGQELAFATFVRHGDLGLVQVLTVASVATGAARTWTAPAPAADSISSLNWLGDGRTLALGLAGPSGGSLRLLDTTAPGRSLLDSRPVLALDNAAGRFSELTVSRDGKVAAGTEQDQDGLGTIGRTPALQGDVVAFALRTGRAALRYRPGRAWDRFHHRFEPSGCDNPLWLSPAGQRMLVFCTRPGPDARGPSVAAVPEFLVLDGRHVTALPWLAGFGPAMLAFGADEVGGPVATGTGGSQ